MAKQGLAVRATVAPGGFDALATVTNPLLLVEFARPGLIARILLNGAANAAFLNGDPATRWLETSPGPLFDAGIDVLAWTTWDWDKTPPPVADRPVGSGGGREWWRFTFSYFPGMSPSCLLASAASVTDLIVSQQSGDETARFYPVLLKEVEEMAGFGQYVYWPNERRGLWNDGIARMWTVPKAATNREFETTIAAIHPEDLHPKTNGRQRSGLQRDTREVRIVRTDGEVRYIRSTAHRHVDENGRVERVVRVDKDVTDLHRAEEELRLAREAASDAARAKDAFLHLMNHSLRTPLNAILGFGEAMRDQIYGPLSADYMQCIDAVNDSASRLLELVHDILDLTRLESGHYSLSKTVCDLPQIVAYGVDLMGPRVTERNLRLAVQSEPDVEVWGEERGLRQILINLIEYATVAGRETHTVTVGASKGENSQAILWLRDDGEGLMRGIEAAMENPLATAANPVEPGGASGWFGFALIKSFLELHNGELRTRMLDDGCQQIEIVLPR